MDLYRYVAGRIRSLRTSHAGTGVSQEELAKAIHVTPNTISRWETATYKPDLDDLEKLARFFHVSLLDLLPDDAQPKDQRVSALLRAAQALPEEDIEELKRYAEFRRAQSVFRRPRPRARSQTKDD